MTVWSRLLGAVILAPILHREHSCQTVRACDRLCVTRTNMYLCWELHVNDVERLPFRWRSLWQALQHFKLKARPSRSSRWCILHTVPYAQRSSAVPMAHSRKGILSGRLPVFWRRVPVGIDDRSAMERWVVKEFYLKFHLWPYPAGDVVIEFQVSSIDSHRSNQLLHPAGWLVFPFPNRPGTSKTTKITFPPGIHSPSSLGLVPMIGNGNGKFGSFASWDTKTKGQQRWERKLCGDCFSGKTCLTRREQPTSSLNALFIVLFRS